MKAWLVSIKHSTDKNDTELVFAATRGKAASQSDLYRHGYKYLDMKIVRAPELDNNPVSDRALLESGYEWVVCKAKNCENKVTPSDLASGHAFYGPGDQAFCRKSWLATRPFKYSVEGAMPGGKRLTRPLEVRVVQSSSGCVVNEEMFYDWGEGDSFNAAVQKLKDSMVITLNWLRNESIKTPNKLGENLLAQLEWLEGIITE